MYSWNADYWNEEYQRGVRRRGEAAWCWHGSLTSGHHWPAGFAAADLSWAASDRRLGSDWFAQLRHCTHTASRAHPESKKESGGTEKEGTWATILRGITQHFNIVSLITPWIWIHNFPEVSYHLTVWSLSRLPLYGQTLSMQPCIITPGCLLGAKTCPIISLWC